MATESETNLPMNWLVFFRRYAVLSAALHLVWEVAHLPLYTVWETGSFSRQVYSILHCTVGDVMIAMASLICALLFLGNKRWPMVSFKQVLLGAIVVGASYTVYSEHINTTVRSSWTYTESMPIIPLLDVGLTPVLQWLIVPLLAMELSRRMLLINEKTK